MKKYIKISVIGAVFAVLFVFRKEVHDRFMFNDREYIPKMAYSVMTFGMKVYDQFFDISTRLDRLEYIKPGISICDYGCGPGRYLTKASKLVGEEGEVFAVDIHESSKKLVSKVVQDNGLENVKFVQSEMYSVDIEDDKFDVIYSFGVFHHLSKPTEFLKIMERISKPDGVFIIERFGHQTQDEAMDKIKRSDSGWKIINENERKYEFIIMKQNV